MFNIKQKKIIYPLIFLGLIIFSSLNLKLFDQVFSLSELILTIIIFLGIVIIYENLARQAYYEQVSTAIKQFRISHEIILEKLHYKSLENFETKSSVSTSDILSEIQILGNLIEKVLQPDMPKSSIPLSSSYSPISENINEVNDQDSLLNKLKKALEQNQIEMLLQPIVSLPQRKLRYFECFSRIKMQDNSILNPDDFIALAENNSLIQTIDNIILFRCIQLIRKTLRKNLNISFFINLSSLTLESHFFRESFVEFIRNNASIAPNLIFEIDMMTLMKADPQVVEGLQEIQKYGCRFSVDQLSSIDIDYQQIKEFNVKFIKIDLKVLKNILNQNPSGQEIKKFKSTLDQLACDMIITRVEDEESLVDFLEFQLDFGQGYLFGAPQVAKN